MVKHKEFVSFVIYTYNMEETITDFLKQINSMGDASFENYEIICVDDGSNDSTIDVIKKSIKPNKSVSIIDMGYHQGKEIAMNAGLDSAIGDFVYEFDSIDAGYTMDTVLDIYERCQMGSDIVCACPDTRSTMGSKLFYYIFNTGLKSSYRLQTDSFRILSRRAINRVKSMSVYFPYRKAAYASCGLQMENFVYHTDKKMSRISDNVGRFNLALEAFLLYSNMAYRLSVVVCMLMLLLTIGISIYAVIIRIQGVPVAGWTSLVLVICSCSFGLFLLLTILIKYTELILKTVFIHRNYTIKSLERISR